MAKVDLIQPDTDSEEVLDLIGELFHSCDLLETWLGGVTRKKRSTLRL